MASKPARLCWPRSVPETLELGDYIRSGLISAIDELAFAVICELDDLSKTVKALKPQSER